MPSQNQEHAEYGGHGHNAGATRELSGNSAVHEKPEGKRIAPLQRSPAFSPATEATFCRVAPIELMHLRPISELMAGRMAWVMAWSATAFLLSGCAAPTPAALVATDLNLKISAPIPFRERIANDLDFTLRNLGPNAVRADPLSFEEGGNPGSLLVMIKWYNGTAYFPRQMSDREDGTVVATGHPGCGDLSWLRPDEGWHERQHLGGLTMPGFEWQVGVEYGITAFYESSCSRGTWRDVIQGSTSVVVQPLN